MALRFIERGSGTPVLFVHGWAVDHRLLLPLDPVFERHRAPWRRLYVDLPGFGATPADPDITSADGFAAALDRWISENIGDQPFAVVASSFGGGLARRLLGERPAQVIGAALLAPTAEPIARRRLPQGTVVEVDEALLATLSAEDAEEFRYTTAHLTTEVWERFTVDVVPGLRAADPSVVASIAPRLSQTPEDGAPPVTRPVLFVLGRQDAVVGWEDQLALLPHYPHATLGLIEGCGHNPHLEHPELVAALLTDWLDQVVRAPAPTTRRSSGRQRKKSASLRP